MDKYQEFLIDFNHSYYRFATSGQLSNDTVLIDNKIILTQNEDITINDYTLYIANESLSSIYATKGEKEIELSRELDPVYSSPKSGNQDRFFVSINFEDKFDGIKIVFKNNLADDLYLPLVYNLADKDKYYAKKEQEHKDNLLKTADIKVSTGADLVNIYFQPCCDSYARTEITLYKDNMMLAKYKVDEETFFKSISGLAYGKYEFILKQFDDKGNIILEADKISFSLSRPNYGGKPTIFI